MTQREIKDYGMKKNVFIAGILLAFIVAASGCKEKTQSAKLPELGEITCSQETIGVGQLVSFSVEEIQAASGSVFSKQEIWRIDGNQVLEDNMTVADGKHTCYFVPRSDGTITVEFEMYYLFSDSPGGQLKTVSKEFDVVSCDARNSFWGESMNVSLERESGLSTVGEDNVLFGTGLSSLEIYQSTVSSVYLRYSYQDGNLVKIEEFFNQSPSASGGNPYKAVSKKYAQGVSSLELKYPETVKKEVKYSEDATQEQISVANLFIQENSSLTDEQWNVLGEAMVKDDVWIVTTCNTETTNIEFQTVGNQREGYAGIYLTYSKR